uniref:Uncharacterized protein n=1 Tax=Oryza nivara TaxID=4536 RepID=A0A0E0HW62_ORYNI
MDAWSSELAGRIRSCRKILEAIRSAPSPSPPSDGSVSDKGLDCGGGGDGAMPPPASSAAGGGGGGLGAETALSILADCFGH